MNAVLSLIYWFAVIAVVVNFVNLSAGLHSVVTGRSHMPARRAASAGRPRPPRTTSGCWE